jgi:hypothetical protein
MSHGHPASRFLNHCLEFWQGPFMGDQVCALLDVGCER